MVKNLATTGVVFVGLALFTLAGWVSVSVWNECRSDDHSILYCLKVISK